MAKIPESLFHLERLQTLAIQVGNDLQSERPDEKKMREVIDGRQGGEEERRRI